MRNRPALCWLFAPALALMAGCSESPSEPKPEPTPPWQVTILRLIEYYEQKNDTEYERLFTCDFTFEFSASADPTLAQQWHTGWFKGDETLAARHLFRGGTNLDGIYMGPASSIDLLFAKTLPIGDPEAPDTIRYKVLSTAVDALVTVPATPPDVATVYYVVTNVSHRIHLVRGDAAGCLDADQPADSLHWYIWKWTDETAGVEAMTIGTADPAARPAPSVPVTWGELKGVYR